MISCSPPLSTEDLLRTRFRDLNQLYKRSLAEKIPDGFLRGTNLLWPGKPPAVPLSRISRLVWQGKHFDRSRGMMANQFFGVKTARAKVYIGESWLDGKPSMILDYQGTSRVFANWRDEVREVAPGLWLGLIFLRHSPPKLIWHFVLQTRA